MADVRKVRLTIKIPTHFQLWMRRTNEPGERLIDLKSNWMPLFTTIELDKDQGVAIWGEEVGAHERWNKNKEERPVLMPEFHNIDKDWTCCVKQVLEKFYGLEWTEGSL